VTNQDIEQVIERVIDRYVANVDASLGFFIQATLGDVVEWEAEGSTVRDMRGNEWLDAISFMGVFGLGHRHPKVIDAVKAQLDRMPLNARYFFNKPQADLAKKLVDIAPGGTMRNVFFCNSGSEAVDVALKSARFTTGRSEIISTRESYHGMTIGAVSVSGMSHFKRGIEPLLPGVKFVTFGDADELARVISDKTACVIVEPVHAGLGSKMAPPDYFRRVRELCDQTGALFIDDEVQTGLGRTGKMWGLDHYPGVAPDLICMGKVLSGGVVPIGATLYNERVVDALSERVVFNTSTFGGGELACAAGLASIEVIEEEKLCERAAESSKHLFAALERVWKKYPQYIREVRGVGMMWTIDLTAPEVLAFVFPNLLREQKVLITPHLNRVDWLRVSPALNVTREQIARIGEAFEAAIRAYDELDDAGREAYAYGVRQTLKQSLDEQALTDTDAAAAAGR
jgi:putrescine aminotransferase